MSAQIDLMISKILNLSALIWLVFCKTESIHSICKNLISLILNCALKAQVILLFYLFIYFFFTGILFVLIHWKYVIFMFYVYIIVQNEK